jgi:Calcineurin-like phosphoesterase
MGMPAQMPVVVTASEMRKTRAAQKALESVNEAASRESEAPELHPDTENISPTTAMERIFDELIKAEDQAGARVLTTPHEGPWAAMASRFQSLIASGEVADTRFMPLSSGGLEAQFDTGDWLGWASVVWARLKNLKPHAMVRPKTTVADCFPNEGRIALVGDWGTGLYGAPEIAKSIRNDSNSFAMIIHLGDVYYSGTEKEVKERFLDVWPTRSEAVDRAINSNHEMYSGGYAYYDQILPRFEQDGSYFACQNEHWTLVGLDVAYRDHAIDDVQVEWLKTILTNAGDRKVILFSHHQLYSHFESQGLKLLSHPGFGQILRSKRILAWYWGHEHRCSIFDEPDQNFGLWARCIGHGGMPQSRSKTRDLPRATEQRYERADWRRSAAASFNGLALPSMAVLEGRNEYIAGEEDRFAPHGYAVLTLDGPTLQEQVLTPKGEAIYERILVS